MEWSLEFDKGDTATVETVLKAMLISSYNDAAYILANHCEEDVQDFVIEMNEYAQVLGLEDTSFVNPSGLDEEEGNNVSTVRDLYRLATIVYHNEIIMNIINKSYASLSWNTGSEKIYTTNALLNRYGIVAGKTGLTDNAGQCFLGFTDDGRLTIVLNSEDRFEDTGILLNDF
jgi:D-alanyl-D-alanine carboxypeptidase